MRPLLDAFKRLAATRKDQPTRGLTVPLNSGAPWTRNQLPSLRVWNEEVREQYLDALYVLFEVLAEGDVTLLFNADFRLNRALWARFNRHYEAKTLPPGLIEDCVTRGVLFPGLDPRYPDLVTQDTQGPFRPQSVTGFGRIYHQFFGDHF